MMKHISEIVEELLKEIENVHTPDELHKQVCPTCREKDNAQ